MSSALGELRITAEELEDLTDLNPINILAIAAYRAFFLRKPKQFLSVLLGELSIFGIVVIFVTPISLIVLRNSGNLPEDTASVSRLLTIMLGFSLLGILLGNIYLWKQARQIKPLARLLDEVDKYNNVIQAVELIDKLESAGNLTTQFSDLSTRQEVVEILTVTKQSLISALKVERLIRRHQRFVEGRYELLVNLENNLNTLMSFDPSQQTSEYGHLLSESLQIGMSVNKEMRKLQNQKL